MNCARYIEQMQCPKGPCKFAYVAQGISRYVSIFQNDCSHLGQLKTATVAGLIEQNDRLTVKKKYCSYIVLAVSSG